MGGVGCVAPPVRLGRQLAALQTALVKYRSDGPHYSHLSSDVCVAAPFAWPRYAFRRRYETVGFAGRGVTPLEPSQIYPAPV